MLGGPDVWQDFMHNLDYIINEGEQVVFTLAGNPDAVPAPMQPAHPAVKIERVSRQPAKHHHTKKSVV